MSVGIIENGQYNKVAGLGVTGRGYFAGFLLATSKLYGSVCYMSV